MNLRERGITVGDLIIVFLIIITSVLIFKNISKDKKSTLYVPQHEFSYLRTN